MALNTINIALAAPGTSGIYPLASHMEYPIYTFGIQVAAGGNVKLEATLDECASGTPSTWYTLGNFATASLYTFPGAIRGVRVTLVGGTTASVKVLVPGIGS